QQTGERAERSHDAQARGDGRAAERLRNLLVGEVADDPQLQGVALSSRELPERFGEGGPELTGVGPLAQLVDVELVRADRHADPPARGRLDPFPLVRAPEQAPGDPEQPGERGTARLVTETLEAEGGLRECLRGQLARDPVSDACAKPV